MSERTETEIEQPENFADLPKMYLPPDGIYFVRLERCIFKFTEECKIPKAVVTFTIQRGIYEGIQFEHEYKLWHELADICKGLWEDFASLCRAAKVNLNQMKLEKPADVNGCLPVEDLFIEIQSLDPMNQSTRRICSYFRGGYATTAEDGQYRPRQPLIKFPKAKKRDCYERTY